MARNDPVHETDLVGTRRRDRLPGECEVRHASGEDRECLRELGAREFELIANQLGKLPDRVAEKLRN